MGLMTIGAFAEAARLTPKALRLYDEQGLLPPAAVDPDSGYRYYESGQLEHARLIARLRRIGMPLAEIRTVCGLDPVEAAEVVGGYWRSVVADTEARGHLAASLVDQLSGGNGSMTTNATITMRYATHCEAGAVRETNEDAAYAGERLVAVCDGMRGPGGMEATEATIAALRPLELTEAPAAELLTRLAAAADEADRAVRAIATEEHQPVTAVTALLRLGSRLALVHVGDTRAYLLRNGELFQLTQDHTYVQRLVDNGELERAEVAEHPQRYLLVRALGGGAHHVEADLALRTALPGDRYLLCSKGLCTVIEQDALREALASGTDPRDAVGRLTELVHANGAPDNMACVVADLIEAA